MSTEILEKEEALTQDRGNVLATAALYNEKQKGISTVISNALMGGLTYSSPENYSNALQEKLKRRQRTHSHFGNWEDRKLRFALRTLKKLSKVLLKKK